MSHIQSKDTAPSASELLLMKRLWRSAPLSVRDLHEDVGAPRGWSLSTTRTLLARMTAKGLLTETRVDGVRGFVPTQAKTVVMAGLIGRFMRDVLEIDGAPDVASLSPAFTGGAVLDAAELDEIDAILRAANAKDASPDGPTE